MQAQDSERYKNNLKISILSFADNAKIQYERLINKSLSFDFTASYYYLKPIVGTKIEPSIRYYFKRKAPTGWYFQPKLSIGYFHAQESCKKIVFTYNPGDSLLGEQVLSESYKKEVGFIPCGASLKFGIQKYFGKKKRIVFDYNFGLQFFYLNYRFKEETYEYIDANENKNIIKITKAVVEESIPTKVIYWYVFGPGSFFETNLSIGFNF